MDNMQPAISVIVPVYNAEKFLRRCVDSILNQKFTDFEVLLINDGSTDTSGVICDEYAKKDARVRVFHKENGGVSSARNIGLDNALGGYILFCDSDDSIERCLLYSLNRYLCQYKKIDCITYNGERFYKGRNVSMFRQKSMDTFYNNFDDFRKFNSFRKEVVLHLFRRNLIEKYKIRFSTGIRYAEDIEFFIKYSSICKSVLSTSIIGYHNFINQSSAMNKTFNRENILDHYRVIDNLVCFYVKYDCSISKAYIYNAIYNLILTSIGFIHKQNIKLWLWLDFFFKKYYLTSIKLKDFSILQNVILFFIFVSIFPFAIYFKIRKS